MSSKETRIAAIFLKMAGMARDLNLLFFDSLFRSVYANISSEFDLLYLIFSIIASWK